MHTWSWQSWKMAMIGQTSRYSNAFTGLMLVKCTRLPLTEYLWEG